MSQTVRVTCPDCLGESANHENPPCLGACHSQGHIDVDRTMDGEIPTHHPDGKPVVLWVDREWPPVRANPLRLTHED